jgi:hypothetical protein
MQIQVDHLKANKLLVKALAKATKPGYRPQTSFAAQLRKVILGDHKTYRYVLVTALLAKAVDGRVNPLALQAGADLKGAYDARSLCHKVFVPFERDFLHSGLGGSNEPFLNKPARFTHLSRTNAVRSGNDQATLELLCGLLPEIRSSGHAEAALQDAILFVLEGAARTKDILGGASTLKTGRVELLNFISVFTSSSFEGETCAIAVGALLDCWGCGYLKDFSVKVHPSNECGASSNQVSDIDGFHGEALVVAIEVKDKRFSAHDVGHAIKKVKQSSFDALAFVKGPKGTLVDGTESALIDVYRNQGFFLTFYTVAEIAQFLLALMTPISQSGFLTCLFKHAKTARVRAETLRHIQMIASQFGWVQEAPQLLAN